MKNTTSKVKRCNATHSVRVEFQEPFGQVTIDSKTSMKKSIGVSYSQYRPTEITVFHAELPTEINLVGYGTITTEELIKLKGWVLDN